MIITRINDQIDASSIESRNEIKNVNIIQNKTPKIIPEIPSPKSISILLVSKLSTKKKSLNLNLLVSFGISSTTDIPLYKPPVITKKSNNESIDTDVNKSLYIFFGPIRKTINIILIVTNNEM